jgi:hypothetical protein
MDGLYITYTSLDGCLLLDGDETYYGLGVVGKNDDYTIKSFPPTLCKSLCNYYVTIPCNYFMCD